MYHQCEYTKCVWEVMRTERFILCMFSHCIEGKPPDPEQKQPDPPGTMPDATDAHPP